MRYILLLSFLAFVCHGFKLRATQRNENASSDPELQNPTDYDDHQDIWKDHKQQELQTFTSRVLQNQTTVDAEVAGDEVTDDDDAISEDFIEKKEEKKEDKKDKSKSSSKGSKSKGSKGSKSSKREKKKKDSKDDKKLEDEIKADEIADDDAEVTGDEVTDDDED
jgi:hypothetical protein